MAMIEKIRKRQGLLLVMIGLGMLGFLIPYDAVMSLFGRGQNRTVGEVDGASISILDYQTAVQKRRGLFNYTNNTALENEVWNDLLEANILGDDYQALGLDITQDEFDEIRFGDHLSPYVQRTFYGSGVTPEAKDNWRNQFSAMFNDDIGPGRANYEGYAEVITQKRLREKYDALIKKGLYANTLEAKYDFVTGSEKVNIDYVFVKYTDIPDSLVSVSESEVRSYFNKHKDDPDYKQVKARDIEYIKISVEPSESDIQAINDELGKLYAEWQTQEDDSLWVVQNSNMGRYISRSVKETSTNDQDKRFFEVEPGTILEPYDEDGVSKLVKVVRMSDAPDSTVSCRHILLKADDVKDEAEMAELNARADSLKRRYKAGEDWDDLCKRFSEDPGSKDKGGVYEFFPRNQMVKPFENFCFDNPIGAIGAVETSYGIHLIEVLDQRWSVKQAELAEITRDIKSSTNTQKEAYRSASDFSINFNTYESFKNAADTMGYAVVEAKNVRPGATTLAGGLTDAGELVGWSFRAKKGEVSNPMLIGDSYVIATLVKVMEAGTPPFENVADEMREKALEEAKAEYYMDLLKDAANLDEAATLAGVQVKSGRNITLKNATIGGSGAGQEPQVAGLAFSIPNGNMSLPIKGKSGVWVIAPTSDITAAEDKENYFEEQDQVTSRLRAGLSTRLFNAMKDGANLKDERDQF